MNFQAIRGFAKPCWCLPLLVLPSVLAQDQSVNGNLFVLSNLDVNGNTASFGTSGANPGYSIVYTNGPQAAIDFSASLAQANWIWRQNLSNPQLKLGYDNILSVYPVGTSIPTITLNPSGASAFITTTGSGVTTELIKLQSVGAAAQTAQRIAGYTDAISGYIDFKRFSLGGPGTGVVLGTFGGDVMTIRSAAAGQPGSVGIGTSLPTAKLEVVGDAKVSGALTVGGNPVVTSNQLAGYVTLTGSASGLSDLNASALTNGTVPGERLPSDVTRLGADIDLASGTETSGSLEWSRVNKTSSSLADLPSRVFADLQNKPTTLAGYGITDAVQQNASGDVVIAGTTTLQGDVTVNGLVTQLRVAPQGDIGMGSFTGSP